MGWRSLIKAKRGQWPLFLVGLLGLCAVLVETRFGPGASGDSSSYLMGAQNILAGHGFYRFSGGYELKPITGFPPFYSAVLAAGGATGLDLTFIARWFNAILFLINIFLVGRLTLRFTDSLWPALIAQVAMLISATQVNLHAWIMTEPLYIALSLSAILCLLNYLEKPHFKWLMGFSLLVALAGLTRYVGVSLAGAGALALLVLLPRSWKHKFLAAAGSGAIGVIPVYLWLLRNARLAGTMTNRVLIYHPIDPTLLRFYAAELSSWFVPNHFPLPTAVRAAVALVIALGVPLLYTGWLVYRRTLRLSTRPFRFEGLREYGFLPLLIMGYIVAYLAVLFLNSTFLDAATTLSAPSRYLAPVFVVVDILMCGLTYRWLMKLHHRRLIASLGAVYLLLLCFYYLQPTFKVLADPVDAIGYTGDRYKWPAVVAQLDEIKSSTPIISNNPEMVYILTGRPAYLRPLDFDVYQQQYRQDFQQQVDETRSRLEAGAVYVVFSPIESIDRKVIALTGAVESEAYPQATFYVYPDSKTPGN